ncbi:MAG: PHB depolymerase family esterase [Rhodoferax sp.]|nr:PHB depolymerase family esterase [Rhodoferax sp.]
MKMPFNLRVPPFDADAINETIRSALAAAGLDTKTGPMRGVADTIRHALSPAGMPTTKGGEVAPDNVIDIVARVVDVRQDIDAERVRPPSMDAPQVPVGAFDVCKFSNGAGTRAYKLYVPACVVALPPALLVMLHGCTQSADDFAAGTRMNRLAEVHGFLVLYPEQATSANPSKCWNWFKAQDQVRDSGEPSLIAGIVRDVAARHGVDARRIFVAGLSAGAAMAVILGETYPELFAGVGVHSGLPYSSAHDIPSAMAAMKGGRSGLASLGAAPKSGARLPRKIAQAVPTIVFHGDRDHTVQQSNGIEIVRQARNAHAAFEADKGLHDRLERGTAPGGRSFSRTVHADAAGRACVESWTVHGAGHAWAGGSATGSYTDASGPVASAEIVRFFMSLSRAGTA